MADDPIPLNLQGIPMNAEAARTYWVRRRSPALAKLEKLYLKTEKVSEAQFHAALLTDMTERGIYCQWLIIRMHRRQLTLEQLDGLQERLLQYDKLKPRIPVEHRNIMQFKSFESFEAIYPILDEAEKEISQREKKRRKRKQFENKDYKLIYEDDKCTIRRIITKNGAIHLGARTKWCTAAKQTSNLFDHYNKNNDLMVAQPKSKYKIRPHEKYQYGWSTGAYNENDRPNDEEFAKRFPQAMAFLEAQPLQNFQKVIRSAKKGLLRPEHMELVKTLTNGELTEKRWVQLIRVNADFIDQTTEEPSEKMVRAAIASQPERISQLKNADPDLVFGVIQDNHAVLPKVPKNYFTEEFVMRLVENIPFTLRYLDKAFLSEVHYETAMRANPAVIQHVPAEFQTHEHQIMAVNQNPEFIAHIVDPVADVQKIAIRADINLLKNIRNPIPSVQTYAVERKPTLIRYIKKPIESAQKIAVQTDPMLLADIDEPTVAVQKEAVAITAFAILESRKIAPEAMSMVFQQEEGMQAFHGLELKNRQKFGSELLKYCKKTKGAFISDYLDKITQGQENLDDSIESFEQELLKIHHEQVKIVGQIGRISETENYIKADGGLDDCYDIIDAIADTDMTTAWRIAKESDFIDITEDKEIPASAPTSNMAMTA